MCCSQGFYTTTGWDPITGFGSVDFLKFDAVLNPQSSAAPTIQPTMLPTATSNNHFTSSPTQPQPTNKPTKIPTKDPTSSPTETTTQEPTFPKVPSTTRHKYFSFPFL